MGLNEYINSHWQYLFECHSVEEVRDWNRRLKYFRYFRAYGGHANDFDSLDAAIRYDGVDDLMFVMGELGIKLTKHSSAPPDLEFGVTYTLEDLIAHPSIIDGTQWIEQPGNTQIFGHSVFVWCDEVRIKIHPKLTISSKTRTYEVDESIVAIAESLERHLAPFSDRMIDPPEDSMNYLCAANYPILK